MRVLFTATTASDGRTFEAGKAYDLPDASGVRWIKRGVAVEAPAEVRRRSPASTPRSYRRPKAQA